MCEDEEFDSLAAERRRLLPPPHSQQQRHVHYDHVRIRIPTAAPSSSLPQNPQNTLSSEERLSREKDLLTHVYAQDEDKVVQFLQENPDFDVNKTIYFNSRKRESALSAAVSAGSERLVRVLLSTPGARVADGHLLAASYGHAAVALILLERLEKKEDEQLFSTSDRFPEHATPLSVAAAAGHFGLVRHLVARGHTLQAPHPTRCPCAQCRLERSGESGLGACLARLHLLQAHCSPAHLLATASDPLLRAFVLSRDALPATPNPFAHKHQILAQQLADFSAEFIGCCRSDREVELVLERRDGLRGRGSLPRLQLAMQLQQKKFVAHPVVQHLVMRRWVGASPEWASCSAAAATLHVALRAPLLPVVALLLVVAPFASVTRSYCSPVNRMVSHVAAYLVFLALLTCQTHAHKNSTARSVTGLEPVIGAFLIGREINLARMLLQKGIKRFFGHAWNVYDLVMVQILWVWLALWHASASVECCVERSTWPPLHPVLVADALLAVGTALAFGRLLFLVQLHPTLGPVQVSLAKVFADVGHCAVVIFVVILSFCAGFGGLYEYFEGATNAEGVGQPPSLTSALDAAVFFFWGIFSLSPPEYTTIVQEPSTDSRPSTSHRFTQLVGSTSFAVYMLLVNVVLVNMLVAKMTNTFKKVTRNLHLEWTFGITEVKLTFMEQSVLPPPLNLIPTTRAVVTFLRQLNICRRGKTKIKPLEEDARAREEEEFRVLMEALAARYLASGCGEHSSAGSSGMTRPTPSPRYPAPQAAQGSAPEEQERSVGVASGLVDYIEAEFEKVRDDLRRLQQEAEAKMSLCGSSAPSQVKVLATLDDKP